MANITDKQMEVLINCIGAVETGGQVYGKRRYDDYTGAYANASTEDSITIGAFAEFKSNAKALLQEIKDTYPSTFAKYDTANIASDLQKSSWSGYHPAKGSEKAKAIVRIISSDDGIKIQDKRIVRLLNQYIAYAESLGVTDVSALFMCANFIHQGGNSACKRILGKTKKPYTLDNLYAACQTDTGNQVGAYKSRQKMIYNALKQYMGVTSSNVVTNTQNIGGKTMTENELRNLVATTAKKYLGCNEADGSHRKIIDGYNKHTPLARSYRVTYTDAWCATFVSFISIQLGLTDIMPTECGCGAMIELYRKLGRWEENDAYVPKVGDVIMYYWKDNGIGDCVGYPDHVGIVVAISGSTITVIEGNKNDSVSYRTISVNGRYIRGYCLPNYAKKATGISAPQKPQTQTPSKPTASTGKTLSKATKWTGVVNVDANDSLNVRTWADINSSKCSFSPLHKGDEVAVCDTQKASDGVNWYYINYKGKYGFVHSAYVSKKVVATTPSTPTKPQTSNKVAFAESKNSAFSGKYVTTTGLNIRISAGTDNTKNKVITTIPKGKSVNCYGYYTKVNGTNWYLVQYGTITGFVSSKYLQRQ